MSDNNNHLELIKTEINSFMGIDKTRPVLLDFTKFRKKGKTVTILEGDQEVGKTSTMYGLMYLLGLNFDFALDNIVNLTDGTINLSQEFKVGDVNYKVKATKGKWSLEMQAENGRWYPEGEPKATMKKLVGNLGLSPMFLKAEDGDKQIDWFRKTFSDGDNTKEVKLKNTIAVAKKSYTEANREYTKISKALSINELYQNAEANYKKFATPVSAQEILAKLNTAEENVKVYNRKEVELEGIKNNIASSKHHISNIALQIEQLQKQIAQHEDNIQKMEVQKKAAEEFIAENATIKMEHTEIQNEYMQVSKTLTEQEEWKRVLQMEKDMNEFSEAMNRAQAIKDKALDDLQKLTKKFMPEIEGFELRIPKGMDDGDEGLYYKGKTLAQLSESELWGLFMQIWEQKDVQFVFIENVTSLGSHAVELLNDLAQKGVNIFATQMDRKKKTMKITVSDSVD